MIGSETRRGFGFGRGIRFIVFVGLMCALGIGSAASAQPLCDLESQIPKPGDESPGVFGNFALFQDVAAVAANGGVPNEAVYVFRYNGISWIEEQKLVPVTEDYVAFAPVAVSDGIIVVGASRDSTAGISYAGAAYVFTFDGATWLLEQILTASDAAIDVFFGSAVAIADGVILIGSPYDDDGCSPENPDCGSGSVYVFEHDGAAWQEVQKIPNPLPVERPYFGTRLSAAGSTAIIGDCCGYSIVRAVDGEWLIEYDEAAYFTSSAIDGDTACFGNSSGEGNEYYAGQVLVHHFDGTSWDLEQVLIADDGHYYDSFGASVAAWEDMILVGAPGDDDPCPPTEPPNQYSCDNGSVYVYRFDGSSWIQTEILRASNSLISSSLGSAIAFFDDNSLVSGIEYDNGIYATKVYVYSGLDDVDCNANGFVDACDLAGGVSGDCQGNGALDACDIASGLSADCNENGMPDECELSPIVSLASSQLTPIGAGSPQSYVIESAGTATSDVVLTFAAVADLDSTSEWIDVDINGTPIGSIFELEGSECPVGPDVAQLIVSAAAFNAIVGDADAAINMVPTVYVDPDLCEMSYVSVLIEYEREIIDCNENGILDGCEEDCDGNGQPDDCDLANGQSEDCNENLMPDPCDIEWGQSSDENKNGVPDECDPAPPCPADTNGDELVDPLDAGYVLARLGCVYPDDGENCLAADANADGVVDPLDVGFVLARFGNCE